MTDPVLSRRVGGPTSICKKAVIGMDGLLLVDDEINEALQGTLGCTQLLVLLLFR